IQIVEPGYIQNYLGGGDSETRAVTLRSVQIGQPALYGEASDWVASEACLKLDLGEGRFPAMLALGSDDPHHFTSAQATDLLAFFGAVLERLIRRWLG
ncbi:MAG: DUF484 family protein, partial [Pseudomonadota bacterium]